MIVEYIKTIGSFLIFCAFVEILLPGNTFKKYLRVVLGLMSIVVILKPLISVLAQSPDAVVEKMFTVQQSLDEKAFTHEKSNYDKIIERSIISEYKQRLENQIKDKLSKESDIMLISIHINVNEDSNSSDYGEILEIKLTVAESIKVDLISISTEFQEEELTIEQEEKVNIIKKLISDFYNLSQDNIYIIFRR